VLPILAQWASWSCLEGHGDAIQDVLEDGARGEGAGGGEDAVFQDGRGHVADVLGEDEGVAVQSGPGLGGALEVDGASGADA
jgi:hypothetical protein